MICTCIDTIVYTCACSLSYLYLLILQLSLRRSVKSVFQSSFVVAKGLKMDASLTSKQIRQMFIEYFEKESHVHWRGSSTVPHDDPTLLFTNAGMNQVGKTLQ